MIEEYIQLAPFTSYKIGGPARYYCEPQSVDEVKESYQFAREHSLEVFILGKGSNILVADEGFDGLVINLSNLNAMEFRGNLVYAEAGIKFSRMIMAIVKEGLAGIEKLAGIPGTLGGAVIMNAGAYGPTISEVIKTVTWLDPHSGKVTTSDSSEMEFGYRWSSFKERGAVVLSAEMEFTTTSADVLIAEVEAIQQKRKGSQPLNFPSCGSVFKRPTNNYAGALIESSCLKGHSCGGAKISKKHANFIINTGNATAEDVRALISKCREHVYIDSHCKYLLEPEVIFVGNFKKDLWSPIHGND